MTPLTDSTEDAIVNQLVKRASRERENSNIEHVTISPEEPYNYYGDRGIVDLYVATEESASLYEVKSAAALRAATGANDVLRQFNKMRRYFFQDSAHDFPPGEEVTYTPSWAKDEPWGDHEVTRRAPPFLTFALYVEPTPETYEHLIDNGDMYLAAVRNRVADVPTKAHVDVRVSFADPEGGPDIPLYSHHTGGKIYPPTDIRSLTPDEREHRFKVGNETTYRRVFTANQRDEGASA